jgi:hypothetical protein
VVLARDGVFLLGSLRPRIPSGAGFRGGPFLRLCYLPSSRLCLIARRLARSWGRCLREVTPCGGGLLLPPVLLTSPLRPRWATVIPMLASA